MNRTEKERLSLIKKQLDLTTKLNYNLSQFLGNISQIDEILLKIEKIENQLLNYPETEKPYKYRDEIIVVRRNIERILSQFSFIK